MTEPTPVRREVVVAAPQATAYALFIAHIGSWWPLTSHSVFGASGTVAFEGEELVERSGAQRSVWAEVVRADPPHSIELSWHPGRDSSHATELTVRFADLGGTTKLSLEHRGWHRLADPQGAREEYDQGWPLVLGAFQRRVEPSDPVPSPDWYVLLHQPGPAAVADESVFGHPDFAEHVAFVQRLAKLGLLVATGPLPADQASLMTVLRAAPDLDIERVATEDDLSVARGLLSVQVTPWLVKLTGDTAVQGSD
jgi:uncharacterized protein YndB with AHSA1/START domain/uncharacterized protein YciI